MSREPELSVSLSYQLIKLADALATTIDCLLTGNPVEDSPLTNNRLFKRFRAVEHIDDDDQEAIIKLIDAMIAKLYSNPLMTLPASSFERQPYASY